MPESFRTALRAGIAVIGHTLIAAVLILCAALVEKLIFWANGGHDPLLYGWLPLSYAFQPIDIAMIATFGYYGLLEAIRIMRGDE